MQRSKPLQSRLALVLGALAASLAILWPPIANGFPFIMADTSAYVRSFDAAVFKLTGEATDWTGEFKTRFEGAGDAPAGEPRREAAGGISSEQDPITLAGRSIYYGTFLYLADRTFGLWLIAVAQALLTAVCAILTIMNLRSGLSQKLGRFEAAAWVGLVAVVTPVGYFAGYLMPDIFSGLGLLALGNLAFFQHGKGQRLFWSMTLLAALLSHSATLLLVTLLSLLVAVCAALNILPVQRRGLALAGAAVLLAFAGEAAFSWGVQRATGEAPVRPPFVAARIIADGPGYRYLVERCPEIGLEYCRLADRPPPLSSDSLLWSHDPAEGGFIVLPPAIARRLAQEQTRLVLGVLAERPLDVLGSSLTAIGHQLSLLQLPEFNYDTAARQGFEEKLPPDLFDRVRASAAFGEGMPVRLVETATPVALLLSLLILFWRLRELSRSGEARSAAMGFILLLCLGVLLNAIICGALSTPHDRYHMRILWLIPLVAAGALVPFARLAASIPFRVGRRPPAPS